MSTGYRGPVVDVWIVWMRASGRLVDVNPRTQNADLP